MLIRSVEEGPAFVPVVRCTGVVVGVAGVSLGNSGVELVDGVADHAHVGGQLGDALVANGVRGSFEVSGAVHGMHDVSADGAGLVVEGVVVVVLAFCSSEAGERAEGTVALLGVLAFSVDALGFSPVVLTGGGLDVAEVLHQRTVVVHVRGIGVTSIRSIEESRFGLLFFSGLVF